MPVTVSMNSPSTNVLPSTSSPSPTKNAVTVSRSATVMPRWSKRRMPDTGAPPLSLGRVRLPRGGKPFECYRQLLAHPHVPPRQRARRPHPARQILSCVKTWGRGPRTSVRARYASTLPPVMRAGGCLGPRASRSDAGTARGARGHDAVSLLEPVEPNVQSGLSFSDLWLVDVEDWSGREDSAPTEPTSWAGGARPIQSAMCREAACSSSRPVTPRQARYAVASR